MTNKKKILVIQKVHDKGMELINNHPNFDVEVTDDVSVENLKTKIKDCDGASIRIAKLPGEVINEAKNLKIISRHGVGYDNIDLATAKERDIKIAITANANAVTVAEHVMFVLLNIAKRRELYHTTVRDGNFKDRNKLPKTIEKVLKSNSLIEGISENYLEAANFLYLGRGYHFPIALEGALKLKEISYIHAEGYPAAEMKHGPIALIDENMPVVVIATKKGNYHKVVSNIMEIKARGGQIIAVVSEGDKEIEQLADHIIEIPNCDELIAPILANIPLQLLSYHIANKKGCDIDQPRNLAKSVTVE